MRKAYETLKRRRHGIREAQKRGGGQSDRLLWSWARNTA